MKRASMAVIACVGLSILALNLGMQAAQKADRAAVERAVLDYCEAFYEVRPEYLERSVHRELDKFGFWRRSADDEYRRSPMNYEQLVELARRWNSGGDKITEDTPKVVEVFDVLDKTACAKLTAQWGVDFMLLVKYDGKWMIERVLWQSHPK